jgi:hypothetical protein
LDVALNRIECARFDGGLGADERLVQLLAVRSREFVDMLIGRLIAVQAVRPAELHDREATEDCAVGSLLLGELLVVEIEMMLLVEDGGRGPGLRGRCRVEEDLALLLDLGDQRAAIGLVALERATRNGFVALRLEEVVQREVLKVRDRDAQYRHRIKRRRVGQAEGQPRRRHPIQDCVKIR